MARVVRNIVWVHDPPPMAEQQRLGVGGVVFTHALGSDPDDMGGFDHSDYLALGVASIDRVNHGYDGAGTIPPEAWWVAGAARIANWARATPDLRVLVLGNEPNMAWERPGYGSPAEEPITPALYAEYWKLVWEEMKAVRPDVHLVPAPVAPWNTDTRYPGNENGDWLQYWWEMLQAISGRIPDGVAVHAYTHGTDKVLVSSEEKMAAPGFQGQYYHWLHAIQLLDAMPDWAMDLPIYVTETNQNQPWSRDPDNGWCVAVAHEVQVWRANNDDIRCFAAYCWHNRGDGYGIVDNPGAQEDLRRAVALDIMADWGEDEQENGGEMVEVYRTSMNGGFYDYKEQGELTVPVGSYPAWAQGTEPGVLHRPEYDAKDSTLGHSEVLSPPYSACAFAVHATMDAAFVFEVPVVAGAKVEADVYCMGVSHTTEGAPGGLGMTVAVSPAPIPEGPLVAGLLDDLLDWGEWWSVDRDDWQEREWHNLYSPPVVAVEDRVWVVLFARARLAAQINAAHWDDLVVFSSEGPGPSGTLAEDIRASAIRLREEAARLDSYAIEAEGTGVARLPVLEARDLLSAALA